MSETLEKELAVLAEVPAADLKKRGWRGVMRVVAAKGPVLVTNHSEPEAVIVTATEYARLVGLAKQAQSKVDLALDELRRRFDARLAVLETPRAGERLRGVLTKRTTLGGRVKAGRGR